MRSQQYNSSASAQVIEVIVTRIATRGAGTEDDPVRTVIQVWTLDGTLIAESEEWGT